MGEESLNIKKLIGKAINRWYLYAIALFGAVAIAYLYILITPKIYQASSLLLIKDDKSGTPINQEQLFSDLGIFSNRKNLENEIYFLNSSPLISTVVEELRLNYEYYKIGRFRNSFLYGNSPIAVLDWQPQDTSALYSFEVTIEEGGKFSLISEEISYQGEFGKVITIPSGKLTLSLNQNMDTSTPIEIVLWPIAALAGQFQGSLSVGPASMESSILSLSFKDQSPHRAKDILDRLMMIYNRRSLEEKNSVYRNSIDLINERVQSISEELMLAEQDVEAYKRRFNMIELSSEGNMLMGEIADFNRKISENELQIDILNNIEDFLVRNQSNFEFVPTNLKITNLTLSSQIKNFNDLLKQRSVQRNNLGPAHPDLLLTERQINNLRETIISNIQNIKDNITRDRGSNQSQKSSIQQRISSLPRRERELIEMERQKGIKENLYLYLLQKREESAVSLAVTVPNGKVIEPGQMNLYPISPKKKFLMTVAIFMGLLIPSIVVFLLEILDTKIDVNDELEDFTSVPVAGIITTNRKSKDHIVVKENQPSVIAEVFRLLRANLSYIRPGEGIQTLLVTSSMSGEGKSFISANLGVTMALSGKKTIVIELDFRRPVQSEYFQLGENHVGIVNYLVNQDVSIDEIISSSGQHTRLEVIPCGPKPPNPAELMLSPRLHDLIRTLKERYDFVIMDCPPVGMVSDPLSLAHLTDATMFVAKFGVTRRSQLDIIEDISKKGKLPTPFIVLNGAKPNQTDYRYGYGGFGGRSKGYYE